MGIQVLTRVRIAVLAILDGAAEPLSASSVRNRLGSSCCGQATVYRALNYLEAAGKAESFVLRGSEHGTQRYFFTTARSYRCWFQCESCHRFIDIGKCRIRAFTAMIESEHGLEVRQQSMHLSGLCAECRRP